MSVAVEERTCLVPSFAVPLAHKHLCRAVGFGGKMTQLGMMRSGKQDAIKADPELREALVRQLYSHCRAGLLGALAVAFVLAFLLRDQVPRWILILWLSCYTAPQIPRQYLISAFNKGALAGEALVNSSRWFVGLTVLSAVLWGAAGFFFFPYASWEHQYVVALVLAGMSSGAALVYSPLAECYLPVLPAMLLPLAARYLSEETGFTQTLGLLVLVYALVLILTARRLHLLTINSVKLGLEKDGLIVSLEERKDLAEELNKKLLSEIEERGSVETALRRSEEEFRLLFENAVDAIFWGDAETGIIVRCNKAAERLVEKDRDEIIGSVQTALHPSHSEKYHAKCFKQHVERCGAVDVESEVITKTGRIVPVRITSSITSLGGRKVVQGIFRDISQRKKNEHELRLLSSAVEQSSEGIALVGLDGTVLYLNKAAARMHGYEPAELIGKNLEVFHSSEHMPVVHMAVQRIRETGSFAGEIWHVRSDGEVFPALMQNSLLRDEKGNPVGLIGTMRDITDLKRAEAQLLQETRRFRKVLEHAPFGIVSMGSDGTLTYANPRFRQLFGYGLNDIPDTEPWLALAFADVVSPQESSEKWTQSENDALLIPLCSKVLTVTCKDNTEKIVEFTPVKLPNDERLLTCEDITDRKQNEDLLIAQRDLSVSLSGARSLSQALQTCIGTALNFSGLDCAGVYVLDEDGSMNLAAHRGFSSGFAALVSHLDSDSPQALRSRWGKPIYATHRAICHDWNGTRQNEALRGLAIIPIVHEGKVIACFNLASRVFDVIPSSTRTALETMALQIGSAIARIRTEEALRRSEARFRQIFDEAPVMMHSVDRSGIVRDVNAKWRKEMGYTRAEVVGTELRSLVAPSSTDAFTRNAHKFWSDGRVSGMSYQLFKKNGTLIDVLLDAVATHDPVLGEVSISVMVDMTDRKRMEDALRDSEHRYRTLFEYSPISLWIEDLSGLKAYLDNLRQEGKGDLETYFENNPSELARCVSLVSVVDVNETTLRTYQAHSKEQFLNGVADLVCDETWESIKKEIIAVAEGRSTFEIETVNRTFAGDKRNVFLRWAVTPGHEQSYTRVLVSVMDITRRKRAEELLVQSERIKAVGEMAGGVAHNFNNLLQIVIGRIQMAQSHLDAGNPDGVKANLDQVLDGARMGAHTVKRLQDFARVRTKEPELEGTTFDFSGTVRDAVEMSAPLWKTSAHREGLSIELQTYLAPGCLIQGNENELFEVVVNLIKNAVEALPTGGRIGVSTSSDKDHVILRVTDSGAGIAKENLIRVLEPFWTTKGDHGTGLGLASSYGIVRRHGGSIQVESVEGEGATFTVTVPKARAIPREKATVRERSLKVSLNVLIVDDIEPVLKTLQDALSVLGQTVFCAQSGPLAIEIFRKTEIDVVICDLGMPEMNGWEVAKAIAEICEEKGIPKTPFILLTGWGGQLAEGDRMVQSGVDLVVEKPLDVARLAQVLREVTEAGTRSAN